MGTEWGIQFSVGDQGGLLGEGIFERLSKEKELGLKALRRGQKRGPPVSRTRSMNNGLKRRACMQD